MDVIAPYLNNLSRIKDQIPELAREALKKNYSEIVMLVKSEQLGKGLNSMGLPLQWTDGDQSGTGYYAAATQNKYNQETVGFSGGDQVGKPFGKPYNFSWTGSTLDNMKMDIGNDAFEVFTTDGKRRELERIYGEIFTLTEKHNNYVNNEIILPHLYNFILDNFHKI